MTDKWNRISKHHFKLEERKHVGIKWMSTMAIRLNIRKRRRMKGEGGS